MKRYLGIICSSLLAITLVLGSFSFAVAAAGDDPTVTPVSGDTGFITEIVPIAHLPGTTELASQMLVPVGFPAGEAQFGGNGIRVSGMDSGKATACFSLNTIAVQQGWGGMVGVWNGTKWVLLPTAITTASDESAATTACATITGNGTYAFIQYVVDASLLPKAVPAGPLPECSSIGVNWGGWGIGSNGSYSPFFVDMSGFNIQYSSLPNTLIEYFIINSNVPLTGDLYASVISNGSGLADFSAFTFSYSGDPITTFYFTVHVETPVCYEDFNVDWSWALPFPPSD